MARITIVEAAKQGFKSRSQINKDVSSGKLPHTRERDRKVIEIADLIKLYGEPGGGPVDESKPVTVETAFVEQELEAIKAKNARLETELRETKDELNDERAGAAEERNRWLGLVEGGNKRMEDMRKDHEDNRRITKELTAAVNKPLWKKLFGG